MIRWETLALGLVLLFPACSSSDVARNSGSRPVIEAKMADFDGLLPALLAALEPRWHPRESARPESADPRGLGLGTKELEPLNGLRLGIAEG